MTFALLGFGPMAQAFALHAKEHQTQVHLWNRTPEKISEFLSAHPSPYLHHHTSLKELVKALPVPRTIFLLLQAGQAIDTVLTELIPLLTPGDIIGDMGNSYYKDTKRRQEQASIHQLSYCAIGMSGGVEGARKGAAFMLSGPTSAVEKCTEMLTPFSYKKTQLRQFGEHGEGHLIKMIHNGIEYAHMDIWRVVLDILKKGLHWTHEQIIDTISLWEKQGLQSYLQKSIQYILQDNSYKIEDVIPLLEQKGSTHDLIIDALQEKYPLPLISRALEIRLLSTSPTPLAHIPLTIPRMEHLLNRLPSLIDLALRQAIQEGLEYLYKIAPDISRDDVISLWKEGCIISGSTLAHREVSPDINISESDIIELVSVCRSLGIFPGSWEAVYGTAMSTNSDGIRILAALRDHFGYHGIPTIASGTKHSIWNKQFLS